MDARSSLWSLGLCAALNLLNHLLVAAATPPDLINAPFAPDGLMTRCFVAHGDISGRNGEGRLPATPTLAKCQKKTYAVGGATAKRQSVSCRIRSGSFRYVRRR